MSVHNSFAQITPLYIPTLIAHQLSQNQRPQQWRPHSSVYSRVWYNSDSAGGASAAAQFVSPAIFDVTPLPANSNATWRISLRRLATISHLRSSSSSAESRVGGATAEGEDRGGVKRCDDLARWRHCGDRVSGCGERRVRLIE